MINGRQKSKIIVILLLISFILWISSTWPVNLSYQQLRMDSFGTFEHVLPWFWISLLICIIIPLFYNRNKVVIFLSCLMLGLVTVGTLAIIQPLGTHHDSFFNLMAAVKFFEQGYIPVGTGTRDSYPLAYNFWGILQSITGLSFNTILKYHTLLIMQFYLFSGYLMSLYFFDKKDRKFWIYFLLFILLFGSRFSIRLNPAPQTVAMIASIFFLSTLFIGGLKFRIIQLIFLVFIVTTHALTSHYLICVLIGLFAAEWILKKSTLESNLTNYEISLNILMVFFVVHIAWFVYVGIHTFRPAIYILKDYVDLLAHGSTPPSALPQLYQLGTTVPTELLIANRVGWALLIFIATTVAIAIFIMVFKKRDIKKGMYLIMWISAILANFFFFSFYTRAGLILDRWFAFMLIPAGLAFAYALNEVINKLSTSKKRMKIISSLFIVLLVILGFATVYTGHYTDNFNSLTQTEINASQFNQFGDDNSDKLYIGCEQSFDASVVVSNQNINTRAYIELNYNNTLVQLERKIIISPMHSLIYNNGNAKFYSLNKLLVLYS